MSLIIHQVDNGFRLAEIDDEDDETVLSEWVIELGGEGNEKDQYEAVRKVVAKVVEVCGPNTKTHILETRLVELVKQRGPNGINAAE